MIFIFFTSKFKHLFAQITDKAHTLCNIIIQNNRCVTVNVLMIIDEKKVTWTHIHSNTNFWKNQISTRVITIVGQNEKIAQTI